MALIKFYNHVALLMTAIFILTGIYMLTTGTAFGLWFILGSCIFLLMSIYSGVVLAEYENEVITLQFSIFKFKVPIEKVKSVKKNYILDLICAKNFNSFYLSSSKWGCVVKYAAEKKYYEKIIIAHAKN